MFLCRKALVALAFFSRAHIDVSLQEGSGGIGLLFNLLYMGVPVEFLMDINSYLADSTSSSW
jgi:hypothetical protein